MLVRPSARVALLIVAALGACRKNAPSGELVGSFVRQDQLVPGLVTRLHVTPSGITVTSPSASVGAKGTLDVDGKPLVDGKAEVEIGFAAHGAALFASLRCDDDRACAFTTKNGCEGTLTSDGKGNVVLVATGECQPWSGKWLAEKDEPPRASASPPSTCAPCPACPSSPPPPTAPPSASAPPGPGSMGCLGACSDANLACVRECKVGDPDCMRRCGDKTHECMARCR